MRLNFIFSEKADWLANKNSIAEILGPIILREAHLNNRGPTQIIQTSTNAIYCSKDYIVKIFAPKACGYDPLHDLNREIYALKLMKTTKTRVPQLVTYGLLDYENNFHYCIIEHIHIPPVSQFLSSCSPNDVEKLGIEIRATLKIFQSLNIDRPELSKNVNSDKDSIFVHGDLSSNNVLYDGKNIAVIDFEDWQFTSPCAELPAIIFEMIHEHINMAPQFFDIPFTELKDALYAGIKMHYNQSRFIDKYKNLFN